MKREELEKAIENRESVWCVYKDTSSIYEIKAVEIEKVLNDTFLWGKEYYANIKDVFKTEAEAEHYLHHANITRTETLPFLTWEEFKEIGQISFIGKDKKEYILKKDIIWSNNKYTLVDCLKIFNETDFTFSKYFDYTEANFYKAYDECVRLFKESSNDIYWK